MKKLQMKKLFAILLALVMVMGIAACGNDDYYDIAPEQTEEPVVETALPGAGGNFIGLILPTTDTDRWMRDDYYFRQAAAGTGMRIEVLFSGNSVQTERENVERLVELGADVIILAAVDSFAAASAAEQAHSAGVPVIAYERLIKGTRAVDFYVTACYIQIGVAMAQHLENNATGQGNPLYIFTGDADDNNAFLLFEGAWSVLQPRIADGTFFIANSTDAVALQDRITLTREEMTKIVQQVSTNWSHSVARDLAETQLAGKSSEFKGEVFVLAPNDATALSISDAFHMDPEITSIFITGLGAEIGSIRAIIDGRQTMTVFRKIPDLVAVTMEVVRDIFDGRRPTGETTFHNEVLEVPANIVSVVTIERHNVIEHIIDPGVFDRELFDLTGLE